MGHLAVPLPAVFDTPIFVGQERRGLGVLAEWAPVVSVITVAELSFGVAAAGSEEIRDRRAATLTDARSAPVVGLDDNGPVDVVTAWVRLRSGLAGRMPANDSWIAATALALRIPVLTQDDDFDAASKMIQVVRVPSPATTG